MRRVVAVLGSALVLLLGRGTVAGLVPWMISRWEVHGPPVGVSPARVLGAGLLAMGIAVLLESFARVPGAVSGGLKPKPRQRAVDEEARVPEDRALAEHVFVLAYEEPKLRKTFGAEYDAYCARVPRWRPRLRPWSQRAKQG